MALLRVTNLKVTVPSGGGMVEIVRGVSFGVAAGRALAVVGETGSGAAACVRALVGLPPGARVSGEAMFDGTDLLGLDARSLRRIRGASIGVLPGGAGASSGRAGASIGMPAGRAGASIRVLPGGAGASIGVLDGEAGAPAGGAGLHPLYRVGTQIGWLIRSRDRGVGRAEARRRAVELLGRTGVDHPDRRAGEYPHQLSAGTRRRVMIAMALALGPRLLIAEEPTAGLDPTVAADILDQVDRLRRESGVALLLATRDLALAARAADEIVMMYAGRIVERAATDTIRRNPHHPYTKGLLESLPGAPAPRHRPPIPGEPPGPSAVPPGCPFHPRCHYAMPVCAAELPPLARVTGDGDHASACWLPHEARGLGETAEALRLHFSRPDAGGGGRP
ncbi:ABC transporter ATP-binding protein [Sphaerisporangium aureirubrum]|uniref:ABC transporter ATP-binding protein n=1 Tax=Sphaerisporangium aureirubrum TaxID=1544736 RepID=A0ABW1NWR2_9ACTN